MLKWAICALALALSAPGFAQIYKCQEGGKTVLTDRPCHADSAPIVVRPAAGAGDTSEYNSTAARTRREEEYARERERREAARDERREIARDYDRRIEQINERYDRQRCSQLQANIERYESRMRSGAPARLYGIYKSEQAAAQGQFDRECK